MLKYQIVIDPETKEEVIKTSLRGKSLLTTSLLNKGTSFSVEERKQLGLLGKLPPAVQSLEEQVARTKRQYNKYRSDIQRNIFLGNLHDKNEVLFYKLVADNLPDMLPMIYTPVVGSTVKHYSLEYRQPRGLYISFNHQEEMQQVLNNRTHPDIKLIVVTDGERVLGLGDQGVGAMDIPLAKLKLYTLCGGINPYNTIPIMLDVGTNNENLLKDPLYLGWRHERIRGQAYDDFIEHFVTTIEKNFPGAFLHWEDFGRDNARRILERYQDRMCSFNDDMQGTAIVTVSAVLAGVKRKQEQLMDQRIVIYGAGTAGVGIADQLVVAMVHAGMTEEQARQHFWLIDRDGLITLGMANIASFQQPYARRETELSGADLVTVVEQINPTVLIGCSSQPNAFNQKVVSKMAAAVKKPVILPLSNPNMQAEANPADLLTWSNGEALVATGSPFGKVYFQGHQITIGQCNNALSFPGIGLGIVASKATKLTDGMLWAACSALSDYYQPSLDNPYQPLLPDISEAPKVARKIALAVAEAAVADGVSRHEDSIEQAIAQAIWDPYYRKMIPI